MRVAHAIAVIDDIGSRRARFEPIAAAADLEIVLSAGLGVATDDLLRQRRPEVVFIAMEDPHVRAGRTIAYIREALPDTAVVGYSSDPSLAALREALRAGARHLIDANALEVEVMGTLSGLNMLPSQAPHEALPSQGLVVAVVGQKGGIGKTIIAVNVAAALASEMNQSVLIVDLDTRFGDVSLAMDTSSAMTAPGPPASCRPSTSKSSRAA